MCFIKLQCLQNSLSFEFVEASDFESIYQDKKSSLKIKFFGRIFLGHSQERNKSGISKPICLAEKGVAPRGIGNKVT